MLIRKIAAHEYKFIKQIYTPDPGCSSCKFSVKCSSGSSVLGEIGLYWMSKMDGVAVIRCEDRLPMFTELDIEEEEVL